jgi:putative transposase
MALSFIYSLVRRVAELLRIHRMDAASKDAEILALRHQLAVLRRQGTRPRFSWSDRALIATLAKLVPRERWAAFLVTPETILRWHRALVRRRWTDPHRRPGRPALPDVTVEVICRLARENPRWGYSRIVGELKKLGVAVSKGSVANVLRRHGLPPSLAEQDPRGRSSSEPRPRVSWRPTSSMSIRWCCAATTSCS